MTWTRMRQAVGMATAILVMAQGSAALANHPQPAPDISKMDYAPIGAYKPGQPIPTPSAPATDNNPSGKYVAYDTDVFESLNLPSRHPGDESATDPPGSGSPLFGFCPQNDPTFAPWGKCDNHQLEYLDYFERTMKSILGPFGVTVKRYPFVSPGTGSRGGYLDAAGGQAYNIAAVVPGADHPDETVLVSGHYDFTDSGPAAAWDSAEGHAEVIRIAKIMADYWRATGTRPAATVKFIPWDSEESGTFGSIDYVENNIPPGQESKVRGYFNMDPCAGAYPAYRNGAGVDRVPEVLQLADPAAAEDSAVQQRITAFNQRAGTVVDQVLDHLDDTIDTPLGKRDIFVSNSEATPTSPSQRGEIVTALGGLLAFSSDYANFEAAGIPIFNLFPDMFGPHADGTAGSPEGVGILHTPRDNLTSLNALTSTDQTGLTASEGWAKGMEMCSQMEGWYMLQPEMGGGQTAGADPVAYFEALPNEATAQQQVHFDASGSYQYADAATRQLIDDSQLTYSWSFGDGQSGSGRTLDHAYAAVGRYDALLTVTNPATGQSDTMTIPITVVPSNFRGPTLTSATASGRNVSLAWTFDGSRDGFDRFAIDEARDGALLLSDDAEADITRLWQPSDTGDDQLKPWQPSNGSPAVNGNKRHSGQSSYWTGASPTAPSPTNEESTLTLKQPIAVPKRGDLQLSYWSLFQSEGDDEGRVEIALDDGDPSTEPQWQAVDGTAGFFAPVSTDGAHPDELSAALENRTADLSRFAGKRVLLRFRYILGPDDRAASQPAGWYVDDIRLTSGTFKQVATTTATSATLTGRKPGTLAYRVRALYRDGITSAPSNVELVAVK